MQTPPFSFADLCSSEHLPEIEIFSLLEEQIPKYKIRADTLTQFTGYENQVNSFRHKKWYELTYEFVQLIHTYVRLLGIFFSFQDWFVPSPALKIPEEGLALNKDQIRETLNYFRKYKCFIWYAKCVKIRIKTDYKCQSS